MATKQYIVTLTTAEREDLARVVRTGQPKAFTRLRAQILLRVDQGPAGPGDTDVAAAVRLEISARTVARARQAWAQQGLPGALATAPRDHPRRARRLDGVGEAKLMELACSPPPKGRKEWSLRLLADQLVALAVVDSIARETVRQTLKKTNASLGRSRPGA